LLSVLPKSSSNDMRDQTPRNIFLVNFDWRNLFATDPQALHDKLERDHLNADLNHFYFYSWAHQSYESEHKNWRTKHQKTYGLEKLRLPLNIWALWSIPLLVHRKKLKPDIWFVYDFGMVPALWVCKKLYGGKLVFLLNNQPKIYSETRKFGRLKGMYSYVMEHLFVHLVDHFMTINETLKKYLVKIGADAEDITIFSVNTIAHDKELVEKAPVGVIRKRHDIPDDKKILLTVGRLEAEKNWPRSLELFASLGDEYVLVILGMGSLEAELKEQVQKLGIRDRVYFVGYVGRDEIWSYYKDADAFVLLSRAEALGIVFWEAMYVHTPVIGSDVEGIVESLGENEERGRVWREADGVAGYQERVRFCTTESPERDRMIERAKEYVDAMIQNDVSVNDLPVYGDQHKY
jgi:glycosyltransferase involved in cell wall biosynthesis